MEPTDNTEQIPTPVPVPELVITEEAKYYLTTAGKWANFLAVIGFIVTGFIILGILFSGTMISSLQSMSSIYTAEYGTVIGSILNFIRLINVLAAVYCFFFSLYLYQFGSGIKQAILLNNSLQSALAFEKLKSFFKLWGIATIIVIVLYLLIIIGVVVFISYAASSIHQ